DEVRTRHPHMPWRDIRHVGNFYRRQYDNVAESHVRRTVQEHLPPLLAVVLSEIAILDAGA
ncbi:MAG: HepT-like ribonuclease domain-containing protein, partial [Roseiarcus sp.]